MRLHMVQERKPWLAIMPLQIWKASKAFGIAYLLECKGLASKLQQNLQKWLCVDWKEVHHECDLSAFDARIDAGKQKGQELKPPRLSVTRGRNLIKDPTPRDDEEWGLFRRSMPVDSTVYASHLRQCGEAKNLSEGKRIHAHMKNTGYNGNVYLENLLVQMYGRCGALEDAIGVFSDMYHRNIFSWAIMIGAYVQNEQGAEALQLFHRMQLESVIPDQVTSLSVLSACSVESALLEGKRVHACIMGLGIPLDVVIGTAIFSMYAKCGNLENARKLFHSLHDPNLVSWNAIIAAYAQQGKQGALQLYQQMQLECMIPNRATFLAILDASGKDEDLAEGKRIHARIVGSGIELDVVIGTALVHMYGKCGTSEDAWMMFEKMSNLNVVSWTAMIVVYAHHGQSKEALHLFQRMEIEGIRPDKVTFISILSVCANQETITDGKLIHSQIVSSGFESVVIVANALINMYGKCGSLQDAWSMFTKMTKRDLTTWNSIITAYAQHGDTKKAFQLFQQMQQEGKTPGMVTFSSVLSACSRAGLVEEGHHCFITLSQAPGITPTFEHYNCMIDLLGRAGLLNEAEILTNNMPFRPTTTTWMTLLGACQAHLDPERGQCIADRVFQTDPENHMPYVVLSNIYAATGRLNDGEKEKVELQSFHE